MTVSGGPDFEGRIGATIHESEPWWPAPVQPAAGTPNVVFVVFDDVGFSDFGCFGSEIRTPVLDSLAAGGLRYTNFHTTGLCSATRACLLTGRNHHRVGMGTLADWDMGFPGSRGRVSRAAGTVAEMLRPQGWNAFAVGKWHLTPMRETTGAGPYDDWPLQRGFDRFYGFFDGETNHWKPELTHDNHRIPVPESRSGSESGSGSGSYHLTEDLVDRAIEMVRDQKSVAPEKPFFLNLAFGACHAPHQVARRYIEPYLDTFADGYDATRERRLARQRAAGIVPADTELTPRHRSVKPWADLDADRQLTSTHLQAAYAGMLEHTDEQLGRFVAFLDRIGQLDNTVLVVLSDNGASQEGSPLGTTNSLKMANGVRDSVAANKADLDLIGGELLNNNYPLGWAMAGNTPLKRFKQNVHGGGVRDPLIIHWPAGVGHHGGGLRTQFCHAVDLLPTVLDLIGVEAPTELGGVAQLPLDGVSLAPTLTDADAPRRARPQLFELFGHRALWHDGWKVVGFHEAGTDFSDDEWELYHLDTDFAENDDRAAAEPEKLAELTARWWEEARAGQVLPLDDRRFNERWVLSGGGTHNTRQHHEYWPGQAHLPSDAAPDIRDRSYTITAEVEVGPDGCQGVVVAHGDRACGYSLYVDDGILTHDYNRAGTHTIVRADRPVPAGAHRLTFRFTRTGPHQGRGELLIDELVVGTTEIAETLPLVLSFEGLDVGADELVSVSPEYEAPFPFNATLHRVVYHLGADQGGGDGATGRPGGPAELGRQ